MLGGALPSEFVQLKDLNQRDLITWSYAALSLQVNDRRGVRILSNLHPTSSFKTFPEVSSESGGHRSSPELCCYLLKGLHLSSETAAFLNLLVTLISYRPVLFSLDLHGSNYNIPFQQIDWEFITGSVVYH